MRLKAQNPEADISAGISDTLGSDMARVNYDFLYALNLSPP